MTLLMLSVILLSVLTILLSILSVNRYLACELKYASELESDLRDKKWTGAKSGLLISMLGKLNWFHLNSLITLVLLM